MPVSKSPRPVGRPLQGRKRKVRVSFTVSPDHLDWLRSQARATGRSSSSALENLLSRCESDNRSAGAAIKRLCSRYPGVFWDIEPGAIDQREHTGFVIERILEHGSLASVKDLLLVVSKDRIAEVVKSSRRISRRTALFWVAHLGIEGDVRCLKEESQSQLSRPWQ